ncbi:hypothetical protein KR51_00029480 [Rubidibacter lacunae KORDI 51-2]|uniref:Uncharacterized protein n=1 Tax=Rubidibacter lacunae KORDI 51-2 TaxID=582515 RepID=U5DL11_9CHRO|nr:hypothetical protein KR51_00029480 [Rubidibacter lacunae KORDI 51-2]
MPNFGLQVAALKDDAGERDGLNERAGANAQAFARIFKLRSTRLRRVHNSDIVCLCNIQAAVAIAVTVALGRGDQWAEGSG